MDTKKNAVVVFDGKLENSELSTILTWIILFVEF